MLTPFLRLQTEPLYSLQARAGHDFTARQIASITLPDQTMQALIPVTILPDDHPELDERFQVTLTSVDLLGDQPLNPLDQPRLGDRSRGFITIVANDAANGVFRIYSNDPRAENSGQMLLVEERSQFSVELVVVRQGKTSGTLLFLLQ